MLRVVLRVLRVMGRGCGLRVLEPVGLVVWGEGGAVFVYVGSCRVRCVSVCSLRCRGGMPRRAIACGAWGLSFGALCCVRWVVGVNAMGRVGESRSSTQVSRGSVVVC